MQFQVRVQCFHYLRGSNSKERSNSFMSSKDADSLEPDASVQKLTKVLSEMDEAFTSALHPRKTRVSIVRDFVRHSIVTGFSPFSVHI